MKWKTESADNTQPKQTPGHGGRFVKRGDVVQTGVFRPLSDYNESWSPPTDVTISGVFRSLSDEGLPPPRKEVSPPTTKIYIGPAVNTSSIIQNSAPERFSTKITTGSSTGKATISNYGGKNITSDKSSKGVYSDKSGELSKHSGNKRLDSLTEAKRGERMSDPSGESAQLAYRSSAVVSEVTVGKVSAYAKLDSSSTSSSSGDISRRGMHPEARDTGQQRGASPLSRASSPGSSSGSSYNLSSTTDNTADSRGLRITPMGSTTGLLPESTTCSQSKLKVDGGCMPSLSATLTILSLAASLGNFLRLPRVVYLNGGGTFLVVYICISLIFGIPLAFLEIGLGQFCQEGTTKLWRAVPLFKGIGYVKVLASALISIYYPVLMALSLFYMIWTAKGPVPYEECVQPFISMTGEECLKETFLKSLNINAMWFGVSVAFLFLLWALLMVCIFKSDNSYRVAVYFILIPVIICLIALLVECILTDGSTQGLQSLVTFEWENLLELKLWYFAIVQMFFSTHLGFGNIVTCAGRLYSKNNALWTAVIYVVSNLVIGVLAVCLVYHWIGRQTPTVSIPEAFVYTVIYDAAINYVELKQFWPILMFLVIICTGFAAMVAVLYTILVAITLEINKKCSWWIIAGCICIIGFLAGILCIIPENMEIVHILDHYVIGRIVIDSTALELIAFAWIYGSSTLYNDFEFILGRQLNIFWKCIWLITPFLLILVEIWSIVSLPRTGLPGSPTDPVWVYSTGWVIYLLSWVIVISAAIHQIHSQVDYNLSQKFLSTLKPSRNWGPVDTIYRHWWVQWRVICNKTGQRDFTFKRRGTKDYTSSVQKYNTPEAIGTYRATPSSANGTLQHSRAKDKGPFTIPANGNLPEHVCWRGTMQRHDAT